MWSTVDEICFPSAVLFKNVLSPCLCPSSEPHAWPVSMLACLRSDLEDFNSADLKVKQPVYNLRYVAMLFIVQQISSMFSSYIQDFWWSTNYSNNYLSSHAGRNEHPLLSPIVRGISRNCTLVSSFEPASQESQGQKIWSLVEGEGIGGGH